MSSTGTRSPTDTFDSPITPIASPQFPFQFGNHESPQRPGSSGRYTAARRGSTASSIASIGGMLDSSAPKRSNAIVEAGENGKTFTSKAFGDMILTSDPAISTLLSPPIVRTGLLPHTAVSSTSGFKAPSTRDIPPVALTNIPHVEPKAFQSYLASVGSLYEAFQRAKDAAEDGSSVLFKRSKESTKASELEDYLSRQLERRQSSTPGYSRSGSFSTVSSPVESPQAKRRGSAQRKASTVTPLSTIPNVYFEEGFHLENPRTFDIVSERSEVIRPQQGASQDAKQANGDAQAPSTGRKALATNAILQEKLSWYMDTVEIHLISSISTASTSFFAALGSLRELHSEAADSVKRIQGLRNDLAKLDKEMAVGGLKVVNLRRRRENVRKLGEAVLQLREVVDAISRCDDLVEEGNIEEALDGLGDVERLMAGEAHPATLPRLGLQLSETPRKLLDLRGIKALDSASKDLDRLRFRIGKGFEARLLEVLLGDIRNHVNEAPPAESISRWQAASQRARGGHKPVPSASPAYMRLGEDFRSRLNLQLNGLARSNHTQPAATAFREAVLRETKSLIRRHLPSSSDDDAESTVSASTQGGRQLSQQEKSSILARNLRSLDPDDAEDMLMKIYAGIGEALRRLNVQVKVVLDITSGIGTPPSRSPPLSPQVGRTSNIESVLASSNGTRGIPTVNVQDEMQEALDLSSLLGQAVKIAQAQITKVLKVRSEQTSRLPIDKFLRYFTLNRHFALECEAITGQSGRDLNAIVDGQIKEYVSYFNEHERQSLLQSMDVDRWDAKDFDESATAVLSRILDASTRDADTWVRMAHPWSSPGGQQGQIATNGTNLNGTSGAKDKVRSAVIDEQKYILPESSMVMLHGIERYQQLITGVPSMTQELTTCLLDYHKLFESRLKQLILGAGATRSAGLKNITTKHLAIASQALSFVVALIPYVREFVRRHATAAGPLMSKFEEVKRLFYEHQVGINEKLVDIMSSRATTHVSAMKKVDWDSSAGAPTVNAYMETLTKETGTLQKVLAKHLPEMTVKSILDPVLSSYWEQLSKAFQDVPLKSSAGKKRYAPVLLPCCCTDRVMMMTLFIFSGP